MTSRGTCETPPDEASTSVTVSRSRLAGSLREARRTAIAIRCLVAAQAVGLLLWWLFIARRFPPAYWTHGAWRVFFADDTRVALVLVGIPAVVTGVLLITQVERAAEQRLSAGLNATTGLRSRLPYLVLGLFIASGISVLAMILHRSALAARAEVIVILVEILASLLLASGEAFRGQLPENPVASDPPVVTQPSCPERVVAFSGGGIRAASFALGAWNALQREASQPRETPGPPIVALSGGSYMAAAIALVRRFQVLRHERETIVRQRPTPLDWREVFVDGTPELSRLRRHTRDLVEPRRYFFGGVLTLLSGAALNVIMVLGALRFASWSLSWLYATAGILVVEDSVTGLGTDRDLRLHLVQWPSSLHPDTTWWVVSFPVVLGLFLVVVLSLGVWLSQGVRDTRRPVGIVGRRLPAVRAVAVAGLLGLLGVLVLVPSLLFGLSWSALSGAPTQTTASALRELGFTTRDLCETRARRELSAALAAAELQARANPGLRQTLVAGACGTSSSMSRTFPENDSEALSPTARDRLILDAAAAQAHGPGATGAGQTAVVTAVVSLIGVAMRRAGAGTTTVNQSGWRARARRVFLAWLPLTAAALILLWLFLSWTYHLTVDGNARAGTTQGLLPFAAVMVAVWSSANLTSLHPYYRWRLSSAFAMARSDGVDDTSDGAPDTPERGPGSAVELPDGQTCSFSSLGTIPLHVVTTANVRAYDEAPTRRCGFPIVFSSQSIRMIAADRTLVRPTQDYDEGAGLGQVSVMSVVAMSGAAVSPMAGRFAATVAPYRILLTLFNVRVGCWVANPMWIGSPPPRPTSLGSWLRRWPQSPWLIGRPGAAQVATEAFGQSRTDDRWLYLSDGGHLDNTGVVEAVRLLQQPDGTTSGFVLAADASNDMSGSWSAVGDALSVLRSDLGVELHLHYGQGVTGVGAPVTGGGVTPRSPWFRRTDAAVAPDAKPTAKEPQFARLYRGRGRASGLTLLVVKAVRPDSLDRLPEPVRSFALVHQDFPRASTTRQDFGDLEFEAYRALGEWYTAAALFELASQPDA